MLYVGKIQMKIPDDTNTNWSFIKASQFALKIID